MQVCYINGIYFGEKDIEANRMKHRDQEDRPKYPLVKFGSEPIDEKRFYFYKSIASKMMQDYKLANRTYQITVDTATLGLKPPIGVAGEEKLETDIYFPGASVNVGKDTKFTQFPVGNEASGYNLLSYIDSQINESTQDPFRQGVGTNLPNTAFQQAQLTQNAKIQLGLIGKMIIQMIKDLGNLMIDDIIHHETVADVEELLAGSPRLKFRTFLIPNQKGEGKTLTREIRFSDELIGKHVSEEDMMKRKQKLFEEEGGDTGKKRIFLVNPSLFRKLKFMIVVDADTLLPKNEAFENAMKLDGYAKAIVNPLIQGDADAMEAVTRDLLLGSINAIKGNEDKYLPKRKSANVMDMITQGMGNKKPPISSQVVQSNQAGALSEMQLGQ